MIDLAAPQAQDYPIESFIAHEKYRSRTKENDIAVIKLGRTVPFTEPQKIRPACLWQSENLDQTTTIAAGFGYTQYSGAISNELMKVQIDIVSNALCKKVYEDERLSIDQRHICAGVLSGGRDTCQGGEENIKLKHATTNLLLTYLKDFIYFISLNFLIHFFYICLTISQSSIILFQRFRWSNSNREK